MIVPKFHPATRSNVPNAPKWIDEFLRPIHEQVKTLTDAMQQKITFGENLNADVRDIKVKHDIWYDVTLQHVKGKPIGVFLVYWGDPDRTCALQWKVKDLSVISVKATFGGTPPTDEIEIRIIVIGK